jgi:hypothetical protein
MTRFKLRIADMLYAWFPKHFCWAGLVSWAFGRSTLKLFKEIDFKKGGDGCKCESETHPDRLCYCGCWHKGKHCKADKDFEKPDFANTQIELVDGLPF